ncbi:hypothetical protein MSG28_015365 [Choristoneura fumiferana]|uniref:Uncharacterized protein n=1 Tax=Choristoneura fumiferana TaxID=7141 RepID=A0ACC0KAX2_CHOFU|nr:hypothetical protein MSG28_015365 [Choristoneura fumiferana]
MVLLGIASYLHNAPYLVRAGFRFIASSHGSEFFIKKTIYEYLWDYKEPILDTSRSLVPGMVPVTNMGMLNRVYSDFTDELTVTIGQRWGHERFFQIDRFNGEPQLPGYDPNTKAEVLREIEEFYGRLYESVTKPVFSAATQDPRAKLTRHYTEDIPDISLYEIRMALKQLKNNKAPGSFYIVSNAGSIASSQPNKPGSEKATVDHIHTLRQVIQKNEEYNLPLCLAFVDYEKAFDSVETWAVLESLQRCRTKFKGPPALMPDALKKRRKTGRCHIFDTVCCRFGSAFKLLEWKGLGININGEYNITHLRFSDDIVVVMAKSMEELSTMLQGLNRVSQRVGLKMNRDKTKVMSNVHVVPTPILVENLILEVVDAYDT